MYTLNFNAYCGMSWEIGQGELSSMRKLAAKILRKRKRTGHYIRKLKKNLWECQEPEDCFMIPDTAGTLKLSQVSDEGY
jgi:hypothetical protein